MPIALMKEIVCPNCQRPTRHRESSLRETFARLSASSKDVQQTFYACPVCSHLGLADIPAEGTLFDFPDDQQHPDDATAFVIFLECASKHCQSRVVVLAPVKLGTDSALMKQKMEYWIDDGAKCLEGHPLMKPYQIAGRKPISGD